MARKFSLAQLQDAYRLIQEGRTLKSVAESLNLSAGNLRIKLHEVGLSSHNISFDSFREQAVADYVSGMSCLAVAKKYGVPRGVITRELSKHGIKCRTGSEANYIRFSKMTSEQRQQMVRPAHLARQGSHDTEEVLIKKALIKESKTCFFGPCENEFYNALCGVGYEVIRQKAVYIYNVDFMIDRTIAVELTVGTVKFQGRASTQKTRIKKLSDCGYTVVTITAATEDCFRASLDKIISDLQFISRNPTSSGQYWVIRCRFQNTIVGRNHGKFTAIKVPEKLIYSRTKVNLSV